MKIEFDFSTSSSTQTELAEFYVNLSNDLASIEEAQKYNMRDPISSMLCDFRKNSVFNSEPSLSDLMDADNSFQLKNESILVNSKKSDANFNTFGCCLM